MPNKPMDEGTAAALDHNRIIEKLDALAKEASEIAYLAYKRLMTAQVERQGEQGYKEYRELHDKELRTYDRCHKEARAIGEKFMAALATAPARHDWSEAKADKHRTTLRDASGCVAMRQGKSQGHKVSRHKLSMLLLASRLIRSLSGSSFPAQSSSAPKDNLRVPLCLLQASPPTGL